MNFLYRKARHLSMASTDIKGNAVVYRLNRLRLGGGWLTAIGWLLFGVWDTYRFTYTSTQVNFPLHIFLTFTTAITVGAMVAISSFLFDHVKHVRQFEIIITAAILLMTIVQTVRIMVLPADVIWWPLITALLLFLMPGMASLGLPTTHIVCITTTSTIQLLWLYTWLSENGRLTSEYFLNGQSVMIITLTGIYSGAVVGIINRRVWVEMSQHINQAQVAEEKLRVAYAEQNEIQDKLSQSHLRMVTHFEEALKLREALDKRNKELDSQRLQFMATMVHDLRQPVQAIVTSLIPLSDRTPSMNEPRAKEALKIMSAAADALRQQLASITDINQLETGQIAASLTTIDWIEVINSVVTQSRAAANDEVCLTLKLPPQAVLIRSDHRLMARVLQNLVSNAIKYRRPRGMQKPFVDIELSVNGPVARLIISDNGIGMNQSDVDSGKIFKPFVRLDTARTATLDGSGLGLAVVHRIFSLLPEHSLHITSKPSEGTTVIVSVPTNNATVNEALFETENQAEHAVSLRGKFFIVIDDDQGICDALAISLEAVGVSVNTYPSVTAVKIGVSSLERCPDLIISDYQLAPKETAAFAINAIEEEWGKIPVLIITGLVDTRRIRSEIPDAHILHKPLTTDELLFAAIQAMNGNQRGR